MTETDCFSIWLKLTLTSNPPARHSEAFQTAWKPFLTSYNAIATVAGVWTPKMRKCTLLFVSEKNPQALIAARSESPNTSPLVGSPNSEVYWFSKSRTTLGEKTQPLRTYYEKERHFSICERMSIGRECCCTGQFVEHAAAHLFSQLRRSHQRKKFVVKKLVERRADITRRWKMEVRTGRARRFATRMCLQLWE